MSEAPSESGEELLVHESPNAETTPERILDVAERLFAEKGFSGAAVRDIARAAGLTAPSLYNHFESKKALYEAVLERGVRPLADLIARKVDGRPDQVLDEIMDHFASHPNLAKLIQHESLIGGESLSSIAHGWLRPIVKQGMQSMRHFSGATWTEEEEPLVAAAWIHMILGHFAMAQLSRELFDVDPLAKDQVERQKRFMRRLADLMRSGAG